MTDTDEYKTGKRKQHSFPEANLNEAENSSQRMLMPQSLTNKKLFENINGNSRRRDKAMWTPNI